MSVNWRARIGAGILGVLAATASAEQLSDMELPTRTESRWVTRGSDHNGHLIQIMRFESDLPMDGVLQHYRTRWQSTSDAPGFLESSNSGWHIIGRLTKEYQWVVQVKPRSARSGSEGIISLLALENTKAKGLKQVNFTPVPRGGSLVSTTHSEAPSLARTQTMLFSGKPVRVADNYKHHALDHGWEIQDEFTHKQAVTLRFERSGRQLDVALAEAQYGKTVVFISEVVYGDH